PTVVSARCLSVRNTIRLGLRITGVKTADGVSREVRSFRNIGISACAPRGVALPLSSAKVSLSISWRSWLQTRWACRPEARVPPKHKTASLCPKCNRNRSRSPKRKRLCVVGSQTGVWKQEREKAKSARSLGDERAPEL